MELSIEELCNRNQSCTSSQISMYWCYITYHIEKEKRFVEKSVETLSFNHISVMSVGISHGQIIHTHTVRYQVLLKKQTASY